jgi:Membrane protein involved in the export of O-antigen and teichoic acid
LPPSPARRVAKNAVALYVVRIAGYIVPLITLPLLARVLGPEEYGRVAFAQSFALWLSLIIEYGFNLSATRDVAQHRTERETLDRLAAGVLGAKGVLASISLIVSVVAFVLVPAFRERPVYLGGAWLLAVANGLTPFWYFQGTERMTGAAMINVAFRFLGVLALFAGVRGPADGWKVLFIFAVTTLVAHGVNYRVLYREVVFRFPRLDETVQGLRGGLGMFIMQLPGSLLSVATTFVLGLVASPLTVAHYSGADRLVRPILGLFWPLTQALFPHVSSALRYQPELARRTVIKSFVYTVAAASAVALIMFFAAPVVVQIVLGSEYEGSISVLRVLVALLPINATINVWGYQWLVPLGYERSLAIVYLAAMLVNLTAAFLTVPLFGAVGMAWSVIVAEMIVLISVVIGARLCPAGRASRLGEES